MQHTFGEHTENISNLQHSPTETRSAYFWIENQMIKRHSIWIVLPISKKLMFGNNTIQMQLTPLCVTMIFIVIKLWSMLV